MKEYRCTRNQPYQNPNCFGHTDLEARQGYYINAGSEQSAIALITQLYPNDDAGFTAQLYKTDCPVCRGRGYQIPHIKLLDGSVALSDPVRCELCQGAGRVELTEVETYRDYIDS